jgi:NADH-quinone oxidoreductase subunit N
MNTLIAIIGLGVLCLLFEILNLRKHNSITIIGLLAILGLDISLILHAAYYNMIIVNFQLLSVVYLSLNHFLSNTES